MKALSLWEPWASLMATGAKRIETRSWGTSYRGRLLICAAQRVAPDLDEILADPAFQHGLERLLPRPPSRPVDRGDLQFGNAVAMVDLIACAPTTRRPTSLEHLVVPDEHIFGDLSPGRFAWYTSNLCRLRPFPVRGKQGLFEVDILGSALVGAAS